MLFRSTQELLVIKAGLYNGKLLDVAGVKALATIPSREELLSKLLGVMQAPVSAMARVLGAVAAQKAAGAPAPVAAAPVAEAAPAAPEAAAEPAAPTPGTEANETPAAE